MEKKENQVVSQFRCGKVAPTEVINNKSEIMEQNFESVGAITRERKLASECAVVLVLVADEKKNKK